MSGFFGQLARSIARAISFATCFALAVVLFGLAIVSMAAITAQKVITAATYEQVLSERRIYERLPDLVGAQLSLQIDYKPRALGEGEGPSAGGAPSVLKDLTAAQWSELATALLPPGWLPAQINAVLEAVLGDPPATEVRIEVRPLREHLRTGAALRAYRVVAQALPPCDAEADEPFDLGRLGRCRPLIGAGGHLNEGDFDRALASELDRMPDYTTIQLPGELGGGEPSAPRFTLTTIRTWLIALALSPIIPAVLLILLLRHRAALRWIGVPLIVAAALTFSAGLAAESTMPMLETMGRAQVPDYWAPTLTAAIFELVEALGRAVLDSLLLATGACVLLGIVAVAVSIPTRIRGRQVQS